MKPMISGVALLAAFSLSTAGLSAAAEPLLSENEALRQAQGRADVADITQSTLDAAAADAVAAGLPPNPTLDYSRDRTTGSATRIDSSLRISQSFDIAGKRELWREAAERRRRAIESETQVRRIDMSAELRRRFFAVLWRQQQHRAIDAWRQRLVQIEPVVVKLQHGGEVSGYDRRRLSRERIGAVARLEAEHAELEHALERLAALLGTHERKLSPSGKLLPDATPPLDTLLSRLQDRPQLKAWEARAAAADLDGQAARRGWLPDVTLGIGAKRVDDGLQRDKGITFTASIPLPVFDRRQTAVQRATAEAKLARSEYRLNRATTEAEIRGLHQQSERLRNAALEFRAQAVAASSDLIRIATAAYQAGESTLLEMLDAHKGMFDAESAALELEWQARASRIELDQLTGTLAP